jgi:23S rRNA (guanosine2251-2'-O)-methyltransferase
VKNFRSPQRPKKSTLIVGRNAVLDAIAAGQAIERIYLGNKVVGEFAGKLRKAAGDHQIPVNYVPVEKLNGFNVEDHDGCIAIKSKIQYQNLQEIISWVVEKGETPYFLILDGITDIRNIGGIARTAYCTGVQALIIPDKGVGSLNEDALLTSAGALENLPVCRVNSLMKAVDELHLNGIKVLATEMKAEKNLFDLDLKEPLAIVMGSEERGISPALMKICDERFKIPMAGEFESLNVSVATGIILFEGMKQRNFPAV